MPVTRFCALPGRSGAFFFPVRSAEGCLEAPRAHFDRLRCARDRRTMQADRQAGLYHFPAISPRPFSCALPPSSRIRICTRGRHRVEWGREITGSAKTKRSAKRAAILRARQGNKLLLWTHALVPPSCTRPFYGPSSQSQTRAYSTVAVYKPKFWFVHYSLGLLFMSPSTTNY